MLLSIRHCLLFVLIFLSSGCVTTGNVCGNEQRDWGNFHYPKGKYCSVPDWMPLKAQYESANKAVCKVHDNNAGRASTMSLKEADDRFLCDYVKRSQFPWGVRHATGYLSYWFLRANHHKRHRRLSAWKIPQSDQTVEPEEAVEKTRRLPEGPCCP